MHPLVDRVVPEGRLAVHWFGQSSFAVKSPVGTVLFVDPYFPHERPAEKFKHAEAPLRDEAELPAAGVLLTHDHSDHTHPETLARLAAASPRAVFVGPVESARRTKEAGIGEQRFVTVEAGDSRAIGDFTAHFVYSKPPRGDPKAGIKAPDVTHLGIVLESGGVKVYFSGDPIHTFAELDELTAPLRELAPLAGWLTCHPTEGEFPFFAGSVKMARRIGLKQAFPSHYDCFVKRDYNPRDWARGFEDGEARPRIVGYNETAEVP